MLFIQFNSVHFNRYWVLIAVCLKKNKYQDSKEDFLGFFQKEERQIRKQLVQSLGKMIGNYQMNVFGPSVYELVWFLFYMVIIHQTDIYYCLLSGVLGTEDTAMKKQKLCSVELIC